MLASISIEIVQGSLGPAKPRQMPRAAGAVIVFEGIVRGLEDGRVIKGLNYEVYEPMASNVLLRLAQASVQAHRLADIHVQHSRGFVAVGECSFRLGAASAHRQAALAAMAEFIDCLKRDVPIWKSPVFMLPPAELERI